MSVVLKKSGEWWALPPKMVDGLIVVNFQTDMKFSSLEAAQDVAWAMFLWQWMDRHSSGKFVFRELTRADKEAGLVRFATGSETQEEDNACFVWCVEKSQLIKDLTSYEKRNDIGRNCWDFEGYKSIIAGTTSLDFISLPEIFADIQKNRLFHAAKVSMIDAPRVTPKAL